MAPKLPTYFNVGITASKENVVAFFQFEYAEFSGYVHFFPISTANTIFG